MIKWLNPYIAPHREPVDSFTIEYRTVGPWVPLAEVPGLQAHFLWETVSRGAKYQFRVYATRRKARSEPSKVVHFFTRGR